MKQTPSIIRLTPQWLKSLDQIQASDGVSYFPSRPIGFWSFQYRLKAALMVFKGEADALVWPPFSDSAP